MIYYSEQETGEIRLALEETILSWPGVETKKMFGCPCYKAGDKLFAFLVTKALVITRLNGGDRDELSRRYRTAFFQAGDKKIMRNWIQIPIQGTEALDSLIPFVRRSYESALSPQ